MDARWEEGVVKAAARSWWLVTTAKAKVMAATENLVMVNVAVLDK